MCQGSGIGRWDILMVVIRVAYEMDIIMGRTVVVVLWYGGTVVILYCCHFLSIDTRFFHNTSSIGLFFLKF
jgi:hypothetical protein